MNTLDTTNADTIPVSVDTDTIAPDEIQTIVYLTDNFMITPEEARLRIFMYLEKTQQAH